MDFSRDDRIFLLFVSERCPLTLELKALLGTARLKAKHDRHDAVLDVSLETIRLWRSGAIRIHRSRFLALLKDLLDRLEDWKPRLRGLGPHELSLQDCVGRMERFHELLWDQRLDTYQAGELLKYPTRTHVQYELDRAFYRERPILASALYDLNDPRERRIAEERADAVVGVYHLYLERSMVNGRSGRKEWWLCPMRVRYLLRLGRTDEAGESTRRSHQRPNLGFIRVKMSLPPMPADSHNHSNYDGALIVNEIGIAATLETRTRYARDLMQLSFLPMAGHGEDRLTTGQYLTVDQGSPARIVSGRALLHRIGGQQRSEPKWATEATGLMVSGAKRLRASDLEHKTLNRLLRKLPGSPWET